MTTPDIDVFTLLDPSAAPTSLLTLQGYVDATGKTERTVRRWLAAGELPGAELRDGAWMIPADAVRRVGGSAEVARIGGDSQVTAPVSLTSLLDEQPALLPLDVAARLLGTSEYSIKSNRDMFDVRRIGRGLVVPQRVVRELAGL
ncbi:hypothetical protein [Agromyces sp. Root81]|uniref:hypothetical protein n=1 Tax=Agromyces sp. Root81 TaxID=1736601 RepID=UPI0012FAF760|nr:hypothetical protein [Agromyces sp. Root81]